MRIAFLILLASIANTVVFGQEKIDWDQTVIGLEVAEFDSAAKKEMESFLADSVGREVTVSFGSAKGVAVTKYSPGYPAEKAGIPPFTVLYKIDGTFIKDVQTYEDVISKLTPGKEIYVEVFHPKVARSAFRYAKSKVKVIPLSKRDAVRGAFKTTNDEIENTTLFELSSHVAVEDDDMFEVYVVKSADKYHLRIQFRHNKKDYIGLQKAIIKADKDTYEYEATLSQQINNSAWDRQYREWFDVTVTDDTKMINDVLSSNYATIRLDGRSDNIDRKSYWLKHKLKIAQQLIRSFEE